MFEDDFEEQKYSDIQGEDATNISVPIVSEPPTEASLKISTLQSSSVLPDLDIFDNIINEIFLNLSQTPPLPLFPTSTSPITTSILISSIPPLLKFSSVNTSQP